MSDYMSHRLISHWLWAVYPVQKTTPVTAVHSLHLIGTQTLPFSS